MANVLKSYITRIIYLIALNHAPACDQSRAHEQFSDARHGKFFPIGMGNFFPFGKFFPMFLADRRLWITCGKLFFAIFFLPSPRVRVCAHPGACQARFNRVRVCFESRACFNRARIRSGRIPGNGYPQPGLWKTCGKLFWHGVCNVIGADRFVGNHKSPRHGARRTLWTLSRQSQT